MTFFKKTLASLAQFRLIGWSRKKESSQEVIGFFIQADHFFVGHPRRSPMKCQLKYHWVKLPRACLPQGKGVLGQWARLAARAAYRKGVGLYCGFQNPVEPGMWAGGVVGLKSILGAKSRTAALESLERLQTLGYVSYSLDRRTKKLVYTVLDRVVTCTGEACLGQGVYAYEGQGVVCHPWRTRGGAQACVSRWKSRRRGRQAEHHKRGNRSVQGHAHPVPETPAAAGQTCKASAEEGQVI